ncbi:MAG: sugar ABC transporter ATP-binding protein [Verrucomicrobia bacterium]|nr:sugar ABC transporter ATP-binding protein [Verrucomicrobiota bacterium]
MINPRNFSNYADNPLLSVRGIRKLFGNIEVLKKVGFDLWAGEVHALVGENGAGKSTLMNILAGVHQPDEGTISFSGGEPVVITDERYAQLLGVGIVFQERSLFPELTVAENIFAGRQPVGHFAHINRKKLFADAKKVLQSIGLPLDPHTICGDLSPAHSQLVEICKALSLNARILIFDEPTSSLTNHETQSLFEVIRGLQAKNVGIIYITHRLEEIFQIANRVTVLKDGEWQGTSDVAETSTDDLVQRMVGRSLEIRHRDAIAAGSPVLLEVSDFSDSLLKKVSFNVRSGEIVGFAGLAGAGRTELALSVFGMRSREEGEIRISNRLVTIGNPRDAIAAGIGYVFEDRKVGGLFLEMSLANNIVASSLKRFGSWWLHESKLLRVAEKFRGSLRIACQSVHQVVQSLSGGNQQKAVLAKWLLVNPQILIVDEPTRGVDVGAKAEVHELLSQLARDGAAVVVISSDLPEVLDVSDRIYVMRRGHITGELTRAEASEEKIMRLASLDTRL